MSGFDANFTFLSADSAAVRFGTQACGTMLCAERAACPAFNSEMFCVASAVATMATGRPSRAAARNASVIASSRAFQSCAAIQSLSTNSTSGPVARAVLVSPIIGSASAKITSAAISNRNSSSHSGVRAGVSSVAESPSNNRNGGNTTRRGTGGVTRNSQKITGKAASAARTSGAPKLILPSQFIVSPRHEHRARPAQRCIKRDQRQFGPVIGAMGEIEKAQAPRQIGNAVRMRLEPRAIFPAHAFRAPEDFLQAAVHRLESRAAREWKILLRRVDDMNEMGMQSVARQTPQHFLDFGQWRK